MSLVSSRSVLYDAFSSSTSANYPALGIPEYWRFDETGGHHGTRLAGNRLVEGRYKAVTITETGDGALEGYSAVLHLHIRWDDGQLRWYDPETNEEVPTFEQEREGRLTAEARADSAETRADTAEARVRELEEELARRDREA